MPWITATIETDRLRLRAFRESDKPVIFELASNPDVRRYLGGPIAAEHLINVRRATVGERWGIFAVAERESDLVVGSVSFDRWRGELEVSYELLPSQWGRGVSDEAVGAALDWAWANTTDGSIIAVTQARNIASVRLLERLGFRPDGEFEEYGAPQRQLRLVRPAPDRV